MVIHVLILQMDENTAHDVSVLPRSNCRYSVFYVYRIILQRYSL